MSAWKGAVLVTLIGTAYFGTWLLRYRQDPAFETVAEYVRSTPELAAALGPVDRIGPFPVGWVDEDSAELSILAHGERHTATVHLVLQDRGWYWRVVNAYALGDRVGVVLPSEDGDRLNQARVVNYRGFSLMQSGEVEEALTELDRAVELDPRSADARFQRGMALQRLGRHPEAVQEFRESHRLVPDGPDTPEVIYQLALSLHRSGRQEEALEWIEKALELRPESGFYWYVRAVAKNQLDDWPGALADLRRACDLGFQTACQVVREHGDEQ